ncbi:hypothetical protein COY05_00705 [Candidatus Peregrinibacteria bacterium CG_4_10_14_0_2_um_filter_38_24]|nr:MAG: hypothetical protein COY05_00705 [Candidatus Peregrinibacteria bacterium CG_4_10_14_0_2_um_filter_38_24]PJC39399.1 MAG: hypothetical protein CO044_00080 [Candidatus Peregrinibacteria bacterium CG_4_9_14_0_2_um_filter_38_9]
MWPMFNDKNKIFAVSFVLIGLALGLLLTWQFKTEVPKGSTFPVDEIDTRKDLLKNFLDEQAYAQSKIVFLRNEIEKSQSLIESKTKDVNIETLDKLKRKIGLSVAEGEGVEIVIDDGPTASREGAEISDTLLVQASDLRDLVNMLNSAKSDAISVNNQRIIAESSISSIGTSILINNTYISPPFTIKAVGDSGSIMQRIMNEALFPLIYKRSKKGEIRFKAEPKAFLSIPIYNGDLKTNNLNIVNK